MNHVTNAESAAQEVSVLDEARKCVKEGRCPQIRMLRDLLATGSTTVLEIYFVLKRARIEWMRFDHGKFPHHVYTSEDDQAKDYAQARIQELMLTRLRDAQA